MATRKNLFLDFLTSGTGFDRQDDEGLEKSIRLIILNLVALLGLLLLSLFGLESLRAGKPWQAIFDWSFGAIVLSSIPIMRITRSHVLGGYLCLGGFLALCAFLVHSGGVANSGVYWMFSYPLLSIFIHGHVRGAILSGILGIAVGVITLVPGMSEITYPFSAALRILGVYGLILVCAIVYEQTRLAKDRVVRKLTKSLAAERDEIAVMKDNMDDAVFLMDKDLVIQGQYAKSLEKILGATELQGRSFLDLLIASLTDKERATLSDYLSMVLRQSHDRAMLEDINPLVQFRYESADKQQDTRYLSCSFNRLLKENVAYILCTIRDETEETLLKHQLALEESKRNEEMKALFEVVHIEPRVLNDFIDDAEHEFRRVNEALKDRRRSSKQLVSDIFQSIHAIKSNAAILGLDSFASKLHVLEQDLKRLSEADTLPFSEVLRLTVRIDEMQQEKDHVRDLIQKIISFKFGEGRMQHEFVMVRTLEKVVEKLSHDLSKKVHLKVEAIDPIALEHGPRRLIKDIMIQLLRNAIVHGVESESERVALGKPGIASVRILVTRQDDKLTIQVGDDGKGLNYELIYSKAREKGLIKPTVTIDDKATLLKVLFSAGFSTQDHAHMHAGRGVGLGMVRDRVKEAGGNMKLQSDAGKGTMFMITLPMHKDVDILEEHVEYSQEAG